MKLPIIISIGALITAVVALGGTKLFLDIKQKHPQI